MTLKQMEVFIAIAESGSFSKGGEKAGITQSTASQHIHGLEKELGIRLFDRGTGGALLTGAGKLFLSRARKIISDCNDSRAVIRRFLGMEGIVLSIGASDVPATLMIPIALGQFQKNYTKVFLDVQSGSSGKMLHKLLDEDVELAFVGGSSDDERISFEPIGEDSIVCAVSPELYSGIKGSLSQAQLCKVPLIAMEEDSGTQQAVLEALAGTWLNKYSLRIVARFSNSESIRQALLGGAGYAFISSRVIAEELNSGNLIAVRIPGVNINRKLFAARREGRELSPAAAAFMEMALSLWKTKGA